MTSASEDLLIHSSDEASFEKHKVLAQYAKGEIGMWEAASAAGGIVPPLAEFSWRRQIVIFLTGLALAVLVPFGRNNE